MVSQFCGTQVHIGLVCFSILEFSEQKSGCWLARLWRGGAVKNPLIQVVGGTKAPVSWLLYLGESCAPRGLTPALVHSGVIPKLVWAGNFYVLPYRSCFQLEKVLCF